MLLYFYSFSSLPNFLSFEFERRPHGAVNLRGKQHFEDPSGFSPALAPSNAAQPAVAAAVAAMEAVYYIICAVVLGWIWLLRRPFSKPTSVAVVVLGDFGRSPRMQVNNIFFSFSE